MNIILENNLYDFAENNSYLANPDIVFNRKEDDHYIQINEKDIFKNKYEISKIIKIYFDRNRKECFFSMIENLNKSIKNENIDVLFQIYILKYIDNVCNLCSDRCLCDNVTKDRCMITFNKYLPKLLDQIKLITDHDIFYPIFIERYFKENDFSDITKINFESNFEKNLIIFENIIFGNIIMDNDFYHQDYVFSFKKGLKDFDFALLFSTYLITKNKLDTTYFNIDIIPDAIYNKIVRVIKQYESFVKKTKYKLLHIPLAHWFYRYKNEIIQYSDRKIKFKAFISNLQHYYLGLKDIEILWDMFDNCDEILHNVFDCMFINDCSYKIMNDKEFQTGVGISISGKEILNEILKHLDIKNNYENYEKAPTIFKWIVLKECQKNLIEIINQKEKQEIKNILIDIHQLKLFDIFPLDISKHISLFFDIWNVDLKTKLELFSSPNTMKLFYHDISKMINIYKKLNIEFIDTVIEKQSSIYPNNVDVYSFLKSIILGNIKISPKNLSAYFQDKNEYEKIVVLVFDGLGLINLLWGSYFISDLKSLISNPNIMCPILSKFPTLTGVNHTALLSGKRLYEDQFFINTEYGFEKHPETKKYFRLRRLQQIIELNPSNRAVLFKDVADLFSFTDSNEFISSHTLERKSYLTDIIARNANNVKIANEYIGAIEKAFKSDKKLVISQVNIFDKYSEEFSYKDVVGDIYEYWNFSLDLLKTTMNSIRKNITPDTLVIITSDHGLSWFDTKETKDPEELINIVLRELQKKIPGLELKRVNKIMNKIPKQTSPFYQIWNPGKSDIICLFFPIYGPRRVGALYVRNKEYLKEITSILKKFKDDFIIFNIDRGCDYDPSILISPKNGLFYRKKYENGFFVGKHGGVNLFESLVPLIIFSKKDLMEE